MKLEVSGQDYDVEAVAMLEQAWGEDGIPCRLPPRDKLVPASPLQLLHLLFRQQINPHLV